MKVFTIFCFFLLNCAVVSSQTEPASYLDKDYPGSTPKLFADSIFSQFGFNKCLYVASDKKQYYFQSCRPVRFCNEILCLYKSATSKNIVIDTILDSKRTDKFNYCTEPWVSFDMQELYFAASADIWKMTK